MSTIKEPAVPKYQTSIVLEIEFEHNKLRSQRTEWDLACDYMEYIQAALGSFIEDFPGVISIEYKIADVDGPQ